MTTDRIITIHDFLTTVGSEKGIDIKFIERGCRDALKNREDFSILIGSVPDVRFVISLASIEKYFSIRDSAAEVVEAEANFDPAFELTPKAEKGAQVGRKAGPK